MPLTSFLQALKWSVIPLPVRQAASLILFGNRVTRRKYMNWQVPKTGHLVVTEIEFLQDWNLAVQLRYIRKCIFFFLPFHWDATFSFLPCLSSLQIHSALCMLLCDPSGQINSFRVLVFHCNLHRKLWFSFQAEPRNTWNSPGFPGTCCYWSTNGLLQHSGH